MHSLVFIALFTVIALLALALTVLAWRRSRSPGGVIFAWMMTVVVVWLAATAVGEVTNTLTGKVLAEKFAYLGISWIGTLWLAFAVEFVFPEQNVIQRYGPWLSIGPLVNIAVVMTNELHGFLWRNIVTTQVGEKINLVFQPGWWLWVLIIYTYLALAAGSVILLAGMRRFPKPHRRQAVGLFVGMAFPWIANFLHLSGLAPQIGVDLTPLGFALTGMVYAITVFRLKLFDLAPLVHEFILENIGEGYIVIDTLDRVVEVNRLAVKFLNLNLHSYWGKPVTRMLSGWPALVDLLHSPAKSPVEISIGANASQYLEATLMDWYKGQDRKAGCIIILRDVTRRRMAEESLRESERLYRLVVNTMPVGIAITDEFGRVTFASPQLNKILLVDENTDIVGKSALHWLHPDERGMGMLRLLKVIEQKENLPSQVYRFIRPDGSMFWGEIISSPMENNGGAPKGMLAIVRDVSQRKELEDRLQLNLEQQTFINSLLQTLYRTHDVFAALSQVLEQTGIFTKADRLYLCKDSADGEETTIMLEWCRPGLPLRAREGALFRYATVPTWRNCIKDRGMLLAGRQDSVPVDIAEFMTAWNVLSIAAFPVYGGEERLYGFLAFDYCAQARAWTQEDLDILWNVCRIVSGAVAQREIQEAEHHQRILAEVLHDTASALNSTLNFEEVLDRILINLEKIVPHDSASIALVDDEGIVKFVRWRGYDETGDALMRSLRISVADRYSYRTMAETGEPIIIPDTWLDKNWVLHTEYAWIRAYAGMPIKIKGKIAGFINLDHSEPDSFTPGLIHTLSVFADQAAIAFENARLYDATHHRAEEMSILYRIGLTLTTGLEMNEILHSLFDQCRAVLPIDVFYVALYDSQTGMIELPLFYREGTFAQVEPRDIREKPGITGIIIQERKTISLPDTLAPGIEQEYGLIRLGGSPSRSYVGVPLLLLNQVVGVLSMQSFQPYAYSEEQVRLLETIGTQAAIAVQNARLYDQMKQMAITDSVTNLFTRRHFTMLGRNEVERALRYKRSLGVLMVDIDHFKRINDTYGHTAGDQVLLLVANVCQQALRTSDIVGRWGGEEYAVILPEVNAEGAAYIAERIRSKVADTEIVLGQDSTHVTISIGVAVLCDPSQKLEELIDCADRALYVAKQSGRNQVQVDEQFAHRDEQKY